MRTNPQAAGPGGAGAQKKKTLTWHTSLGEVSVQERVWRTKQCAWVRLFCKQARVSARGCSLRLQRLASDFGLESSFEKAALKRLREHHGVQLAPSTLRNLTRKHAARMREAQLQRAKVRTLPAQGAEVIITQVDGSMLPHASFAPGQGDKRKRRQKPEWQEARLAVAQRQGSQQAHYAPSFGDVEETGEQWARATCDAHWAANSKVHALGDGAEWIRHQHQTHFARHGNYLVDFYHVCEKLAPASAPGEAGWLEKQKERLRNNQSTLVISELAGRLEAPGTPDENAPVRTAHRYLSNRTDQLDYQGALAAGLPIGSGLVESAHRHIFQSRLKIPGAAWLRETAEAIAHARALRANDLWDSYWASAQN